MYDMIKNGKMQQVVYPGIVQPPDDRQCPNNFMIMMNHQICPIRHDHFTVQQGIATETYHCFSKEFDYWFENWVYWGY